MLEIKDKSIEHLRQLAQAIRDEIWRREHALARQAATTFIGKCFKYKNSYGNRETSWWLYAKVLSVDLQGELQGIQFQYDTDRKYSVEVGRIPGTTLQIEITLEEWEKEYESFLAILHGLSSTL